MPPSSEVGQHPAFANGALVDGKYRVEETIAEGGVGVIVRATHVGLGQRVAIKYLKQSALRAPELVERFEREGRLAAGLASEHVVRVQDVGRIEGAGPYMVMEYLVGRDLGTIVREGALPIARAVDYVLQACDALAEAHAVGIVHRDIKPENLFLAQRPSNTPILKIIDFGISKAAAKPASGDSWKRSTGRQERFGTPLYMSPEQLQAAYDVDERTDIWSLGVVLFELITGTVPFDGEDVTSLTTAVLAAPPRPLRSVMPQAPAGLEAVINRCLQKDRENRFADVSALAHELVLYGVPESAARAGRIHRVRQSVEPPPTAQVSLPDIEPYAAAPAASSPALHERFADTQVLSRKPPSKRRAVGAALLGALVAIGALVTVVRMQGASSRPPPSHTASTEVVSVPAVAAVAAPAASSYVAPEPAPEPLSNPSAQRGAVAPKPRVPASPPPAGAPPSRRTLFGDRK